MWSNVVVDGAPIGRCKHAAALAGTDLYIYGGKSGPKGLRDFWKLELHAGQWEEVKVKDSPPALQGHTLICQKDNMYLFGGQISVETETPLWIFNIKDTTWRKWEGESMAPLGRRGHIAGVYSGYMLIHGGYRDLKGSLGDIWAFHFETESWHLFYRHSPPAWFEQSPEARHNHVGITHGGFLYIHGGMCDLEEKSDFWKFDLGCRKWIQLKAKPNPGKLNSSSVSKAQGFMFVFGGERDGKVVDEFWRFSFDRETWEKISFYGNKPSSSIQLPAVIMLPAIIRIRNVPFDSAYWWDNETLSQPEVKPKSVNVVLKKRGGHYQMVGSQTVEECGLENEQFESNSTVATSNCRQNGFQRVPKIPEKQTERNLSYSTSDYSSMETISDGRERLAECETRFRVETRKFNGAESMEMECFGEVDTRYEVTTPNYLLVIGGYDAQSRNFGNVPMSIWRLRVGHELFI